VYGSFGVQCPLIFLFFGRKSERTMPASLGDDEDEEAKESVLLDLLKAIPSPYL
jgi:hypothetical protein